MGLVNPYEKIPRSKFSFNERSSKLDALEVKDDMMFTNSTKDLCTKSGSGIVHAAQSTHIVRDHIYESHEEIFRSYYYYSVSIVVLYYSK